MKIAQRLATLDAVFEAIPEVEFDQTPNLTAESGHDRLLHNARVDAEPIPELEFEQTLGWQTCALEVAHAAERGLVWIGHWRGAASGVPMMYSGWCAFFACSAQKRSTNTRKMRSSN